MLSLRECENVLNKRECKYSLEEIEFIKGVLDQLAEIEYQQYKNQLNESSYIYESIHGRSEGEWVQLTRSGSAVA
ncbi:hypothetical protein CWM47_33665 [Spirosoma pollinicola]|uniref:Uncharacterized protein n=1 Tax=Spirosoma pollinicola TaxID=2057025 RepID=A0A2K8Z922_9BACT|nr:hypothetical protein CWM47_33665 [Spirosoma pollinicola]